MKLPTTDVRSGTVKPKVIWKSRKLTRGVASLVDSVKESQRVSSEYPTCIGDSVMLSPDSSERKESKGYALFEDNSRSCLPMDQAVPDLLTVESKGYTEPLSLPKIPLFGDYSPVRQVSLFGLPVPNSPPPLKKRRRNPQSASLGTMLVSTGTARRLLPAFDEARREELGAAACHPAVKAASGSDVSTNTTEERAKNLSSALQSFPEVSSPRRNIAFTAGIEYDAWDIITPCSAKLGGGESPPMLLQEFRAGEFCRSMPESNPAEKEGHTLSSLLETPDAASQTWAAAAAGSLELSLPRATATPAYSRTATVLSMSKRKLNLDEASSTSMARLPAPSASGSTPSSFLKNMR